MKYVLLIAFAVGPLSTAVAQRTTHETSFTHIPLTSYSTDNSNLKYQTWAVIQDNRGVVFIADEDGIKVFNGKDWTSVKTASGTTVRSLASAPNGTIYYGAQGEFGQIEADSSGTLVAKPISRYLENSVRAFSEVWATHVINQKVYFQSRAALFVWDGSQLKSIYSASYVANDNKTGFHNSFVVDEELYVREKTVGLLRLNNLQLELIQGGDRLADIRVYMMYSIGPGEILVGTQESGLFKYREGDWHPLRSELDSFQSSKSGDGSLLRLYASSRLSDGLFAIATLGAGLVIIDTEGNIKSVFSSQNGLPDDWINSVFVTQDKSIWLAFENLGAAYLDTFAPIVKYQKKLSVKGRINQINKIQENVVLATATGLFSFSHTSKLLNEETSVFPFEEFVDAELVWSVNELGAELAVGTGEGLRIYRNSKQSTTSLSCSDEPALVVYQSAYSDVILVGTKTGLMTVTVTSDECRLDPIANVSEEIWSIVEVEQNKFWLGTRHEGAVQIELDPSSSAVKSHKKYSIESGLPESSVTVTKISDQPVFYSEFGPYVFDDALRTFDLYQEVWPFRGGQTDSLFTMTEDGEGKVWLVFPDSVVVAVPQTDGPYEFHTPRALKFRKTSTSSLFVEENGIVWLNDGNVLIRYDSHLDNSAEFSYNAFVSHVSLSGRSTAIHNGAFSGSEGGLSVYQPESSIPSLEYNDKDLTFRVAAATFASPEEIKYQIYLDGRDTGWSEFSTKDEYVITGQKEGRYTVHVRATNAAGRLSSVGLYTFIILPPWYRTWWARLIYLAMSGLFVYSGRKYFLMVRAHKLAAEQAEELAREREVNKVLQEANERLTKANRLKDEFLATTSHELRTPLTAILGFTSVLREEIPKDAEYREFLDIIEDSGSRLMDTLNSLLDLAKLRAGMMEINLEICDLYYQCCNGISGLQSAAERKGLELFVERPSETIFVELDVLGFVRILQNLIGNAIKFTESGYVKIELVSDDDLVHIRVCDSGIGIDEEFLPRLFDEFMQESDGPSRSYEGFGLGLAITARLVQLMHGKISVESKKGEGSQFIVTLPRAVPITGEPISVHGFGNVRKEA